MTVILHRAKNSSLEDAMVIPTTSSQSRLAATLADSFADRYMLPIVAFQIQVLYFYLTLSVGEEILLLNSQST